MGKSLPPLGQGCHLAILNLDIQEMMRDYTSVGAVTFTPDRSGTSLTSSERQALQDAACRLGSPLVSLQSEAAGHAMAPGYRVIPRGQIRARLKAERKASYRACYDNQCQIELGKKLAASAVVSARLIRLGRRCTLTLKLYDLKTETTAGAASHTGSCTVEATQTLIDITTKALARR
ncbi:MAG: hypothetical protein KAI47_01630 [Deltaproteobacteria bacterium]|nr:hypothetical protein [Deltaproteobacteria bacterium]